MQKIILSIVVLTTLAGLFVAADYFGLLGTNTRVEMDYAEITVEARNADTGAPVFDTHVRCWKKGADNICTERKADRRDRVSVFIPINKQVEESFMFTHSETPAFPEDTQFHFMLIHHDYDNPIETLDIRDIYEQRGKIMQVMMKPKVWGTATTTVDE